MNDNTNYYIAIQSCHGADHVFLFTEEEINEEFERYNINKSFIPQNDENAVNDILWPMGGSNSSATSIVKVEGGSPFTANAIVSVFENSCIGPDLEDPTLIDMAEYNYTLNTTEGCMADFLKENHLDKEKIEKNAMANFENDTKMVMETLGISLKDFYLDEYRDMRLSEALKDIDCEHELD